MHTQIKTNFLFYTFTLLMCLNSFFLIDTPAQVDESINDDYTFETIDVPGVEFLQLSASSDFGDYAGSTRSPDGDKMVGFTLIDGVFTTYDFPGSKNTYFFALGNNGDAAGHYEDSDGLFHGVVLRNGELEPYDFPGAVQTELWGISDTTGALTGNFIGADGVRRGFSGDTIVEFPGALETYADFVNSEGGMVGSYVDADGIYNAYVHVAEGDFVSLKLTTTAKQEYLFVHGINDARMIVARAKLVGAPPITYVGLFPEGLQELKFPGSVSTEGYNINQDGSVVGHYDTADGRRHGFIARPITDTAAPVEDTPVVLPVFVDYTFETIDVPGVDVLELTASSDFEDYAGNTPSADGQKTVGFTLIDGVFTTYDFPGAQNTYFFALGNNGNAAGYYEDGEGLSHGVILENGELRQYDFPGAVETEIYGMSDATGALTGNFIDASGVRRGFSGDAIIEYPEASATYADFVSAEGAIIGSFIDAQGVYKPYVRNPDGKFLSLDLPQAALFEYFFVHSVNDAGRVVVRAKLIGDIPRTAVGTLQHGLQSLEVPDSVSTDGWNINQDGSIVGNYKSADGKTHGFIARPITDTAAPIEEPPVVPSTSDNYTFETIDVPGVDFLAVTASSDLGDYAGNTKSEDGTKTVGFTLIDGIFTTYDFPGSQNTYFYAFGNNGEAAGHYEDSDGLHHGIILENGELRQYDFPGAVETEIYGYSDSTGALTGSFIDASGVRRGFSGDTIVEYPGAPETYADFVSGLGNIVGSYVSAAGTYHAYLRGPGGSFATLDLPLKEELDYFFLHGLNDGLIAVGRAKPVEGVPRTYVGNPLNLQELRVPDSVGTEGWNINQDGSVVGHYDTADGRRHGFIARPIESTDPRTSNRRIGAPTGYIFESIDVPGVEFLALTASSDFDDYAGNTLSADGEKMVGFTLIDGVFNTYDFPGSQATYFYALGNDGRAAGHYQDSEGLYHGVILENGELRQYDFPGSVQTEIYGISDATGALTGHFIGADGVRRGFSGDTIVEVPGAAATYSDFVSWTGHIVGSYADAAGIYHAYMRGATGRFLYIDLPAALNLEYFFLHGLNESRSVVGRAKAIGDVPRTYFGNPLNLKELKVPGSVSTEGWNINQDGSIVGHYDSPDGRRHGFVARPASQVEAESYSNTYTTTLSKGLNMISVPLAPTTPMTAKSLVAITGATTVIALDAATQHFIAWTPGAPNDGFPIEGGKGYIVNVPQTRNFAFIGAPWTDPTEEAIPASPAITPLIRGDRGVVQEAWAFVVSGHLEGKPAFDGYQVIVRNLRTNSIITASVQGDYFAAATADLTRRSVVQVGDVVELRVIGPDGNLESQTLSFKVTPEHLANAVLSLRLDGIGKPTQNLLMQNYPNPFNPETWIPYQLSEDTPVSIAIYDTTGRLVRTLSLGFQSAGFYNSRSRAAYWDGRNAVGERVASGIYFYQLTTPAFQQTRRLVIVK